MTLTKALTALGTAFFCLFIGSVADARELRSPKPNTTYANLTGGGYKFYTYLHREGSSSISGDTFTSLNLTVTRYGFQFGGSDHDVTIDGFNIKLKAPTKGGDFPAAFATVGEKLGKITIKNGEISGFQMVPVKDKYTNGDGIDCDGAATVMEITNVYAHDNSDGGFDLKCKVELWDTKAERNYRNYRFWRGQVAHTITSINPRNAHVWWNGGATATVDKLIASGDNGVAVFAVGSATAKPSVKACEFHFTVPTKVFGSSVTTAQKAGFGPSCLPDAKGYAINAPPPPVVVMAPPASKPSVLSPTFLDDSNRDGRIVLSNATAAKLKLPRGTVLTAPGIKTSAGWQYEIAGK